MVRSMCSSCTAPCSTRATRVSNGVTLIRMSSVIVQGRAYRRLRKALAALGSIPGAHAALSGRRHMGTDVFYLCRHCHTPLMHVRHHLSILSCFSKTTGNQRLNAGVGPVAPGGRILFTPRACTAYNLRAIVTFFAGHPPRVNPKFYGLAGSPATAGQRQTVVGSV